MELKVTLPRLAVLLVLIAILWFIGGFQPLPATGRAWFYMIILYVGGAVSTTLIDHWVGNLDRSNLRFLYIIMGILCCGGAIMYKHVLTERSHILAPDGVITESPENSPVE